MIDMMGMTGLATPPFGWSSRVRGPFVPSLAAGIRCARRIGLPPRVLVVEDDPFLSLHMEAVLSDGGLEPIGMATSVDEALAVIEMDTPDAAVLDVNLRGTYVFPVADRLDALGIPFVFVSAYASDEPLFPPQLRGVPRLGKPVDEARLLEALSALIEDTP